MLSFAARKHAAVFVLYSSITATPVHLFHSFSFFSEYDLTHQTDELIKYESLLRMKLTVCEIVQNLGPT